MNLPYSSYQSLRPSDIKIHFVQPNKSHVCQNCKDYLVDPYQLLCGHRICSSCKKYFFDQFENKLFQCPSGEKDCEDSSIDKIFPDNSLRRELKDYEVYCTNESEGCTQKCKLHDLKKHLESECPFAIVECPYHCGLVVIFRKELINHFEICPKKPIKCHFESIGCTFEAVKDELEKHINASVKEHLELASTISVRLSKIQEPLLTTLNGNSEKIDETKKILQSISERDENTKKKIEDLKAYAQSLERKIVDFNQNLEEMREVVNTTLNSDGIDSEDRKWFEEIRSQANEQDSSLETQKKAFQELELKLQCVETTNYDGVLIWKIKDFKRRLEDARTGKTLSLYSQPFFTSRYGYRMCARVYLNGDGIGKNNSISFFFVIMKGEYDDVLPWPFKQKITLMLLDQNNRTRNIEESFKPDPTSSSFKKPSSLTNVASGSPKFISHNKLFSDETYLKNDTLFFKIVVDIAS